MKKALVRASRNSEEATQLHNLATLLLDSNETNKVIPLTPQQYEFLRTGSVVILELPESCSTTKIQAA